MNARENFITELWKASSRRSGVRLIELEGKTEDHGLTAEEKREYSAAKEENSRLLSEYLREMYGSSATPALKGGVSTTAR